MSRGQAWTKGEWQRAEELLQRGHSRSEVALVIGKTPEQLRQKIAYEEMSGEKRELIRQRINARRRERTAGLPPKVVRQRVFTPLLERAPPEVFIERERRRATAPRDLTAAFFNDPLPGFSALDRRRIEA